MDLTLSQSTLKVTVQPNIARGPSPIPNIRHCLQVPKLRGLGSKSDDNKNIWGEEEIELIKTCALLSSSLGLSKSLSTSDISIMNESNRNLRAWVSEENVNGQNDKFEGVFPQKLEPMSRSCSTWVAVGDIVSTSQLPSPQARIGGSDSPAITAVDFIRSVNKKVRQNYIKRRFQMSYRVLKRISDHCHSQESCTALKPELSLLSPLPSSASSCAPREVLNLIRREVSLPPSCGGPPGHGPSASSSAAPLTARDVERERGRQLSRYERNMIIFNWLHTLDGDNFEALN